MMQIIKKSNKIEPIVLLENYDKKKILKTVIQYIDQKNKINRVLVSYWCIGVISYLTAAFLIIAGAILYLYLTKRSALYNENCINRSCLKDLNMKCINRTCLCLSSQYYMKGCKTKKAYSEKCLPFINTCVDNQNLSCTDGLCKCKTTKYWNGTFCNDYAGYGGSCSTSNMCLPDSRLVCDNSTKSCSCNNDR